MSLIPSIRYVSGQYSRNNIPLASGCYTWKPNSIGRPFRCFAPKQSSNFATGCDLIDRWIIGIRNRYQALLSSSRAPRFPPPPPPVLLSLLLIAIWQCVMVVTCILRNVHWSLFLYRCSRRWQHGDWWNRRYGIRTVHVIFVWFMEKYPTLFILEIYYWPPLNFFLAPFSLKWTV